MLAGEQWQSLIMCPCSGTVGEGRGEGRIQCTETCIWILFARRCFADQALCPQTMKFPEVSTVTYLTGQGAPTVIFNQTTPDGSLASGVCLCRLCFPARLHS